MRTLQRRYGGVSVFISIVLGFSVVIGGCTTSQGGQGRPRVYAGWVRFAGEFMLYPDAKSFAEGQTMRCISGALPLQKQQEAAAQLSGKRVLVRAKPVPWSLPDNAFSLSHEGSQITNWCGGKVVLLAVDMIVDERPAAITDRQGIR